MKIVDESNTTVYFNIPPEAVITISDTEVRILVDKHPYVLFAKARSTPFRSEKYFYLLDSEFEILKKQLDGELSNYSELTSRIAELEAEANNLRISNLELQQENHLLLVAQRNAYSE